MNEDTNNEMNDFLYLEFHKLRKVQTSSNLKIIMTRS